ncbi:PIG-L family deacetylase [Rhodanobacter sp. 7MK24]|uniref:PIG-L deacetylase family protein n=1 Tax=Rhodanobacter sp. 7MK24 TaxID=2775922 RepID=UPI001784E81C|nr:PIG-L family deacetylase [Rhodanobacter sp. 7MK24]MBD8881286.1 PIG-L family deacetylase [Rhodanobacter sp. 7MK24]
MRIESPAVANGLFVFAHPDDEFGCFESIRIEVESGRRVSCFYLTDGGYGGQPVARRKGESIRVLSSLGIDAEDVHFLGVELGIKDGVLHENMERVAGELSSVVRRLGPIESLYVPAWEGGHQDHDTAHVIALAVCGWLNLPACVWQFSLYHGAGLRGSFFHVMKPLPDNGTCVTQRIPVERRLRYLKLCLSYPSQWKTWLGLFPFVFFRLLFGGGYSIQRAHLQRLLQRPHAGPLLYERRCAIDYDCLGKKFRAFLNNTDSVDRSVLSMD